MCECMKGEVDGGDVEAKRVASAHWYAASEATAVGWMRARWPAGV